MLAREQVLFSSDAGIAVFVNGAWSTLKKADGSAGTLKLKGAPCCRAAAPAHAARAAYVTAPPL